MGKNKNRNKIIARNQANDIKPPAIVGQAQLQRHFTATNSIESALSLSDWDCFEYSQSLNPLSGYNNISLNLLSLQQYLLTYLYKTYGVLGRIIDAPVDKAYKNGGFDLEADTLDENELKELKDSLTKHQDIKKLKTGRKWARLFGGGALIALSGDDLLKPLNPKALYGRPLDFMPVDRWQLNYSLPNINMPNGTWNLVNYNTYNSDNYRKIHSSRVFILFGKEAPWLIQQQVQGWGISAFEQIFQDMNQFFKGRNVLFELLDEAKTDILKLATIQQALSSAQGETALRKMVDMIARNKNYKSQITLSKDDEYEQKQISFSGIAEIFKEIRIMISGSSRIPVNELWGEGVTGFGSGEDSLEIYNSLVEDEVRELDDDAIDWILKLRCYQLFGREIPDLVKTWKKLRVLSAIDEQNITDHKVANVLQLFDRQLLSPQEIMEYLKKQQIFIHDTKALRGELEDMPLISQDRDFTEFKDITKD